MIFCAIADNPARMSLTGQIKGKTACEVCVDQTESIYLPSFVKTVYMRHRRFLPRTHKYRRNKRHFDGTVETGTLPRHRDGKFLFEMVKNIKVVFGKNCKQSKNSSKAFHLKSGQFSFNTCPTGKSWRLTTLPIPCTLRRMYSIALSVFC